LSWTVQLVELEVRPMPLQRFSEQTLEPIRIVCEPSASMP